MKMGKVTIIDYYNYRNNLQNYAGQETFKSFVCAVNTQLSSSYNNILSKLKSKKDSNISKASKSERQKAIIYFKSALDLKVENIL